MVADPGVLIVEDDEDVLILVSELLHSHGIAVGEAMDWVGLSQELFRNQYGVILLDVELPTLDGDELVPMLLELSEPRPRILLHSGLPLDELEQRAKQCQADSWISKSSGGDLLLARVKQQLALYSRGCKATP